MRRLGELEAAVMDQLWSACDESVPVRVVRARLAGHQELAYTTVMTVLDNLHRKGFVTRAKHGRAYLYRAASTREEHTSALMHEVLEASGDRQAALLCFVEQISPEELSQLRAALDAFGPDAVES